VARGRTRGAPAPPVRGAKVARRMATLPAPTTAPAKMSRSMRGALHRLAPAAVTIVGVAVLLRVVYNPWYLNYDARYALLWARDAWHGFTPDYTAPFAPTPHPLSTALSSLALPFGHRGDELIITLVLLSFGALVWVVYRLGAELYSPLVGAVAAVVVLTRPALERDTLLAYQDVPFAALVLTATLLEARRARRGWPVLALLALAGLLRPEAWVLSALYLLYAWPAASPRGRLALAALVATAPALWALTDWLVTGDLLHSLHGTAALAEEADRRRRVAQVPYWTAKYFAFTLREPLVLGVPLGLAFAWLHRRRRSALPVAVIVAMTAVFAIGPLFGLPLIGRYVRTPAVLMALFYGLAVAGWQLLPAGAQRRRWLVLGGVALALSVAFLPRHVTMLRGLERRVDADAALYADLRRVADAPAVRRAFARCGALTTADHRPVPHMRYWLDGPPRSVRTVEGGASATTALFLAPRDVPLVTRFYGANFPAVAAPASYRRLYVNRSWRVDAAPRCVRRPRA
jgi:hypothetical protein